MSASINKNIVIFRHKSVVTSTPIKQTKPRDRGPFHEWPSPLEQGFNESVSPNSETKDKTHKTVEPLEKKTSSRKANQSMDKICLINRLPELCDKPEAFLSNEADVEAKTKEIKRLVIMDSEEEEEFWKTKNNDVTKKNGKRKRNLSTTQTQRDIRTKKTGKKHDPVEESDQESIFTRLILPKNTVDEKKIVPSAGKTTEKSLKSHLEQNASVPSKSLLTRSKQLEEDASSDTKRRKNAERRSNQSPIQPRRNIGMEKTVKKRNPVVSAFISEETDTESIYNGTILPKITEEQKKAIPSTGRSVKRSLKVATRPELLDVDLKEVSSKRPLKRSKKSEEDVSSGDSHTPNNVAEQSSHHEEIEIREDAIAIRRSNRNRCKPLEFWNGERQQIEIDFTVGIVEPKKNPIRRKGRTAEVRKAEEAKGIEPSKETSTSKHTLSSKDTKRRKSFIKTRKSKQTSVRFSTTVETRIFSDTPAAEESEKLDWLENFDQLRSKTKPQPDSEGCVNLPGLNIAGGSVLSTVIQMHPKSTKLRRAPLSHQLIFCLMTGAVAVTIHKTKVQIKKYGHFIVPSGVPYRIENFGKYVAMLSCFRVAKSS